MHVFGISLQGWISSAPPVTRAVRPSGSTVIPSFAARLLKSIVSPFCAFHSPMMECPPPLAARLRFCSRANLTAAQISSAPVAVKGRNFLARHSWSCRSQRQLGRRVCIHSGCRTNAGWQMPMGATWGLLAAAVKSCPDAGVSTLPCTYGAVAAFSDLDMSSITKASHSCMSLLLTEDKVSPPAAAHQQVHGRHCRWMWRSWSY